MKMLGPGSGLPEVPQTVLYDDEYAYVRRLNDRVAKLEELLKETQGKLAWKE